MKTLRDHVDDLDNMVDRGAPKADVRSQIAFIAREIDALQADYSDLQHAHATLKDANAKDIAERDAKIKRLESAAEDRFRQDALRAQDIMANPTYEPD